MPLSLSFFFFPLKGISFSNTCNVIGSEVNKEIHNEGENKKRINEAKVNLIPEIPTFCKNSVADSTLSFLVARARSGSRFRVSVIYSFVLSTDSLFSEDTQVSLALISKENRAHLKQ